MDSIPYTPARRVFAHIRQLSQEELDRICKRAYTDGLKAEEAVRKYYSRARLA